MAGDVKTAREIDPAVLLRPGSTIKEPHAPRWTSGLNCQPAL